MKLLNMVVDYLMPYVDKSKKKKATKVEHNYLCFGAAPVKWSSPQNFIKKVA